MLEAGKPHFSTAFCKIARRIYLENEASEPVSSSTCHNSGPEGISLGSRGPQNRRERNLALQALPEYVSQHKGLWGTHHSQRQYCNPDLSLQINPPPRAEQTLSGTAWVRRSIRKTFSLLLLLVSQRHFCLKKLLPCHIDVPKYIILKANREKQERVKYSLWWIFSELPSWREPLWLSLLTPCAAVRSAAPL